MVKVAAIRGCSYRYNIYQVRLEFRKLFDILVHPSDDGQTNRQINRISTYRLDPRKGSSKNKWKLQYPSVKDLFAIKKKHTGQILQLQMTWLLFFPFFPLINCSIPRWWPSRGRRQVCSQAAELWWEQLPRWLNQHHGWQWKSWSGERGPLTRFLGPFSIHNRPWQRKIWTQCH